MKKLLIVLAVLVLAAPTMAAEWNFYGQARFGTWSVDEDPDVAGFDSDRDTVWGQQGNSRVGATVKFNDQIGGRFEYGNDAADRVTIRQLYGTYNFGAGELLIGQTYTPSSSYFYSNSVYASDGDLLGIGQFYVGRKDMIQLSFSNFKLAFIQPETILYPGYEVDTTFPKVELSYGYKGELFFVDVFGGYQTYDLDSTTVGIGDEDIDSYVVGVGGGMTFGPVFLNLGFHMGENFGNYNASDPGGMVTGAAFDDEAKIIGGRVEDQDGMGYLAVLGFKASDMLTFEAGYGREESEIDAIKYDAKMTQYYLNATINLHKNFFVVPEIGMIEYEEDNVAAEPETFYLGAKWQINF